MIANTTDNGKKPLTLKDVMTLGRAWYHDDNNGSWELTTDLGPVWFTRAELDALDFRLSGTLARIELLTSDAQEQHTLLVLTHDRLWNCAHILPGNPNRVYIRKLTGVEQVDTENVCISYARHDLHSGSSGFSVARGLDVGCLRRVYPISTLKQAYPLLETALSIANALSLTPVECAEMLNTGDLDRLAQPAVSMPNLDVLTS